MQKMLRPPLEFVEQDALGKKLDQELFDLIIPNSRGYMALFGMIVLRNRILLPFALDSPALPYSVKDSLVKPGWCIVSNTVLQ